MPLEHKLHEGKTCLNYSSVHPQSLLQHLTYRNWEIRECCEAKSMSKHIASPHKELNTFWELRGSMKHLGFWVTGHWIFNLGSAAKGIQLFSRCVCFSVCDCNLCAHSVSSVYHYLLFPSRFLQNWACFDFPLSKPKFCLRRQM